MSREEALAEAQPLAQVPSTPFAFIWFLVRTHYVARIAVLVGLAALGAAIDAFGPLALSHLINAITAAVQSHASFKDAVLPWVALFGLIWFRLPSSIAAMNGSISIPRRACVRSRRNISLPICSATRPRYFQENFAGKLGQKVKQAGQATVSSSNILCLDMVRVSGLVIVGGILMFQRQCGVRRHSDGVDGALSRHRSQPRAALRRAVEELSPKRFPPRPDD